MHEQKEIQIKTATMKFIKDNFEFEGSPEALKSKLYDTNEKLYKLILSFMGIPPDELSTGMHLTHG